MKKLIVIVASLLIAASAHAQFGVVAGLTSSHSNLKSAYEDVDNVTQYHVGLTDKCGVLGKTLAIQPSLIYNVKGSKFEDIKGVGDVDFKNGFLEIPVQVQLRLFGLGDLAHVYAIAEPFVGCALSNNVTGTILGVSTSKSYKWENFGDRLEYGIGVGAGVELIKHVQVSVRYFWNLGDATGYLTQVQNALKSEKAAGIVASVALLF